MGLSSLDDVTGRGHLPPAVLGSLHPPERAIIDKQVSVDMFALVQSHGVDVMLSVLKQIHRVQDAEALLIMYLQNRFTMS